MKYLIIWFVLVGVAYSQPTNFGGGSSAIACVGTPGNTTGAYRQFCTTTGGAVYVCNNSAGCTVAADWVSVTGSGSFTYPSGTGIVQVSGGTAWGTTLANPLTGGNGGTGSAFFTVSGPASSIKTFTFPNASATVLTTNTAVTVAQGGTSLATLTAHALYAGNGTSAPSAVGPDSTATHALFSGGSSADPAFRAIALSDLPAVSLSTGTSHTFSGPYDMFQCTGTCTITVPVPSAGVQYCVWNKGGVATVITLSALGSSAQYEKGDYSGYGTAGTGTLVSGGANGDKVCIVGIDATHYDIVGANGTLTAN